MNELHKLTVYIAAISKSAKFPCFHIIDLELVD